MEDNALKKDILMDAIRQSVTKLSPRIQLKNPVMFVVFIGAIMTTVLYFLSFAKINDEGAGYTLAIALIL